MRARITVLSFSILLLAAGMVMAAPEAPRPAGSQLEALPAPGDGGGLCAQRVGGVPEGELENGLFPDGVVWLHTGCEAHKSCTGGCHLTCTGSSSCSIGTDHVNCDGTKTYCNSCCTYGSCTEESDCDPPNGVCAPDVGRCWSSGCCICA